MGDEPRAIPATVISESDCKQNEEETVSHTTYYRKMREQNLGKQPKYNKRKTFYACAICGQEKRKHTGHS